jgi:hypothetical protein
MVRDRRGAGVAEYAILLFVVIVLAAGTFRILGRHIRNSGEKTTQQFAGQGASSGGAGGQRAGSQSGGDKGGGAAGGGGGAAGAGGGGGGQGGSGGNATTTSNGTSAGPDEIDELDHPTPLWKILGAVFLLLFVIGGYFAFRKQKKGG